MKLRAACVLVGLLSLVLSLVPLTVAQTTTETTSALPRLVRFGGTVKDLNGTPLTGLVGITFALYSEQTGGATLWLETQNVTADGNGHYVALLGATKPDGLPTELFTTEQAHWVGVQVSGQPEQPRVLLVSAPYALKAGDAETIGGLPASAFVLANGSQRASGVKGASAPASASAQKNSAPPANPAVTGKGVVDYIPMWDTTSDIVDSIIFQKSLEIGINTTTPAVTLDVNGKTDIRDTLTLFPKSSDSTLAINGTAFKIDQLGKVTFISGQTFPGTGTITGITTASGSGLSGGGTSGTLSLSVPSAGITNTMLANSKITLNANAAGGITTPGAMTLGSTYTIGLKTCSANQVLQYVGTAWTCSNAGTGTITGVTAGTDLTGGGTSGTVTLNLDTTKVPLLATAHKFTANQTVTSSANGIAVYGNATVASGTGKGVEGDTNSTGGTGVAGVANATTGFTQGVWGGSFSTGGVGVIGQASATSGNTIGVEGLSASSAGTAGVFNNTGGGTILSGQSNGTVLFSVNGSGVAQVGTQSNTPAGMVNATSTSVSYVGLVATGLSGDQNITPTDGAHIFGGTASNGQVGAFGLVVNGGDGGALSSVGNTGVIANGGSGDDGAGAGVVASGGGSSPGEPASGVEAYGGGSGLSSGGEGIFATGGSGTNNIGATLMGMAYLERMLTAAHLQFPAGMPAISKEISM